MAKFIKKYWASILNVFYITYLFIFGFSMEKIADINIYSMLLIIFAVILTAAVWFEIIYYIVVAALNKKDDDYIIHAVLCYFLNIFYIPYYNLRYLKKDENYKSKTIIYLQFYVFIVVATIIGIVMTKYVY